MIALENIGILMNERDFIQVDENFQTTIPNVFVIGDVIGGPMLSYKALYEGKKLAEFCMDPQVKNNVPSIPAVVYTDPEIACVGISEEQAVSRV